MNSKTQTKKNKTSKKTATVEPQTATVEPQTARALADIYEDFIYFSCGLTAKHDETGKLGKIPNMPVGWQHMKQSKYDRSLNATAIITGKKSNLTVIDYDKKELFERDKLLYPELLNHYVKIIRVIIAILNLMIKYHLQQLMA